MSIDTATAELRAARQELYEAQAERDRLATARNRYVSLIAIQNERIAVARARVAAARQAMADALATPEPEPTPVP